MGDGVGVLKDLVLSKTLQVGFFLCLVPRSHRFQNMVQAVLSIMTGIGDFYHSTIH